MAEARQLVQRCDTGAADHVEPRSRGDLDVPPATVQSPHRACFLDMLGRSARIQVHRVDEELEDEALSWLRRHDERLYSFVDATSFALMRSLGIQEALAFDGDFAAAGFVELRPT